MFSGERLCGVASPACAAKAALVGVFAFMTGAACERGCAAGSGLVTGGALKILMSAIQCKIRLLIVIEYPQRPGHRIVATRAGRSEGIFVCVFTGVAILTLEPRRGLEREAVVALLARSPPVAAEQWEPGKVVIEADTGQPLAFVVAAVAL